MKQKSIIWAGTIVSILILSILISGCIGGFGEKRNVTIPDANLVADCDYKRINAIPNASFTQEGSVVGFIDCDNAATEYHYEEIVRNGNPTWVKVMGYWKGGQK